MKLELPQTTGSVVPKLTPEHILADRAVNAVALVLNEIGALAERIKNDYGEDLLVQSHLEGRADDFKLLIQVKGANLTSRVIRLKVSHLRRWISQLDPTLVCVLDNKTGLVYAFQPVRKFSLWELATTRKESMSVRLTKEEIFDSNSGKKFLWQCRIDQWSRLLALHENRLNYHHRYSEGDHSTSEKIQREGNLITFNFLSAIGIIESNQISESFRRKIDNASNNFRRVNKERGAKLSMPEAFTLALLGQVDEVCKTGLPGNLLNHGSRISGAFFREWHPKEWLQARRRLPGSKWFTARKVLKSTQHTDK